jgi:hypothetical protein
MGPTGEIHGLNKGHRHSQPLALQVGVHLYTWSGPGLTDPLLPRAISSRLLAPFRKPPAKTPGCLGRR